MRDDTISSFSDTKAKFSSALNAGVIKYRKLGRAGGGAYGTGAK
ncbi:hypothetical protein [Hydrogeniiclostridium mannosilyticum]|nr:hypothetical protein [Hydrogeniiclostridium mannosilyticum]